ncbi:ATP-grasp domain-containing protein [Candidatus Gracilibacteria bacterium]|nr:ATP-grasp domain-containing protein [Candidatus Gracilibacteria bacterium]
MIHNHIHNPIETQKLITQALHFLFTPDTLVLCDTRLLIKKEVLPHIPFVGYYDQRILPILSNTNIIISDGVDSDILSYFEGFGLCADVNIFAIPNNTDVTLTENILFHPETIRMLKNKNFTKIVSLSVNNDVENLAKQIGANCIVSADIMKRANDKLDLKKFLIAVGLPYVEGVSTSEPEIIRKYYDQSTHYFFKSPQGVSGYGFWSNKNNTLDDILSQYAGEEIIIERVIEKIGSPSIQFCIWGEDIKKSCIFGFTDQILENGQHYLGNTSPSGFLITHPHLIDEIISLSEKIIEYIENIGYIGFGGIDFMIDADGHIYATEVNARFTGATYPAISSFLLRGDLTTSWKYITKEGVTETIEEYLNISIQKPDEFGLFPICIAPLKQYGRAQVLFQGEFDEHDI